MSYETDRFLPDRSDDDTIGADYDRVIQSLEAVIRYLLGAPVSVALTPIFEITADGAIEIQVSLSFADSADVVVTKMVDTLTDDAQALPTAHAVKAYVDQVLGS